MINGMILREQSNILEEGGIDLTTQLFMENMNLHIQLFNQEIMNESSYIMEADGNKNFIQKAIDFIKETAKHFWKWLTTKVSEAKEKIMKFLKRKKQEENNKEDKPKEDQPIDDGKVECEVWTTIWNMGPLLSDLNEIYSNDFLNSDEVVNFTKEKYIEKYFSNYNLGSNKSILELSEDDMLHKNTARYDEKSILDIIDSTENQLHDTMKIKKDYDKYISNIIKSLESYMKCLDKAEQNPNAYSGVSLKRDNIDMETSSDYATTTKFKVGNALKLFQLDNQIIMKMLTTKLSCIVKCIDHDTALLSNFK